jgi:hypothetical protein
MEVLKEYKVCMVRMNVQVNIHLLLGGKEELLCHKEELLPIIRPLFQLQPQNGYLEFTLKFTREDVNYSCWRKYRVPIEGYSKFFIVINEYRELLLILEDDIGLKGKRYLSNFVVEEFSPPR